MFRNPSLSILARRLGGFKRPTIPPTYLNETRLQPAHLLTFQCSNRGFQTTIPQQSISNIMSTDSKIVIVTGGNSGLGYETVKKILQSEKAKYTVFLGARSAE